MNDREALELIFDAVPADVENIAFIVEAFDHLTESLAELEQLRKQFGVR